MGQQPNVEIGPADKPRRSPEPDAARRWRPTRPGVITAPSQMPWGGAFGTPGPDTGYARRLIAAADLPGRTPLLEDVIAVLMGGRASLLGRAPVMEDFEVALEILGLGEDDDPQLDVQRERWLEAASQEKLPGRTALNDVGRELLAADPHGVRKMRRLRSL